MDNSATDEHLPATTPEPNALTAAPSVTGMAFQPQSVDEALRLSELLATSDLVPACYKGKPANVMVAITMGAEVGLAAMQALQNIAVINGHPSLWGDAIGALIKTHPHYEWIREEWDPELKQAVCTIKRRGEPERTQVFGKREAQEAGLLSKDTYKKHLQRMCERRARGRCAQDVFPDALKGLKPAEEVMDYIDGEVVPAPTAAQRTAARMDATKQGAPPAAESVDQSTGEVIEGQAEEQQTNDTGASFADVKKAIESAADFEAVNATGDLIKKVVSDEERAQLRKVQSARVRELRAKESNDA